MGIMLRFIEIALAALAVGMAAPLSDRDAEMIGGHRSMVRRDTVQGEDGHRSVTLKANGAIEEDNHDQPADTQTFVPSCQKCWTCETLSGCKCSDVAEHGHEDPNDPYCEGIQTAEDPDEKCQFSNNVPECRAFGKERCACMRKW
mmetsp:Transcript_63566/g.136659  ORF Transcript_63566/g.136659 Transcript_63566/m.136659 type:complete len:145 (+) Transcript_63566:64-498(+)